MGQRITRFVVFGLLYIAIMVLSNFIIANYSKEKLRASGEHQTASTASSMSTASSILLSNGFVWNCITGSMVGHLPPHVQSVPIGALLSGFTSMSSPETEELRQNLFQKVFNERIWGRGSDIDFNGPIASGMFRKSYNLLHLDIE